VTFSSCDGNCLDCLVFDQGHTFLLPVSELLTVTQTSPWAQLTSISVAVFYSDSFTPSPCDVDWCAFTCIYSL